MKSLILALAVAVPLLAQITSYPTSQVVTGQMQVNQANGVPQLDANGRLLATSLPRYGSALQGFQARLAAAATTPATIVVLGDSITSGAGATSTSTSWSFQMLSYLQQAYGYNGPGFCSTESSGSCNWILAGTWTGVPSVGPSQASPTAVQEVKSATSSATATTTLGQCDSLDIYYYKSTDSGSGFTVTVDGSSKGTFGAATTSVYTPAVATISGLTGTAGHTIVITAPASGNMYLFGVAGRSGVSGVNIFNAARASARMEMFGTAANLDWLPLVPNLAGIIIAMGQNDIGTSPTAYQSKFSALIAQAQALGVPILHVLTENPQTLCSNGFCKSDLDAVQKTLAIANGNTWFSISDRWGTYDSGNAHGLYVDGVHPSQAGHNDIGLAVFQFMSGSPSRTQNTTFIGQVFNGVHEGVFNLPYTIDGSNNPSLFVKNTTNNSTGAIQVLGGGDVQIGSVTNNNVNLLQNGSIIARMTSAGLGIGIGGAPVQEKLQVNGGLLLQTATAQPTCSATLRGDFWVVQGATGVKDQVSVCAKDNVDSYAWRTIY